MQDSAELTVAPVILHTFAIHMPILVREMGTEPPHAVVILRGRVTQLATLATADTQGLTAVV